MRFMILVKADAGMEEGWMPEEAELEAMGRFNDELVEAGVLVAADGLHPSSKGARVRFSGRNRVVTDGPFAETKELVAGYWIWELGSVDEAVEWVRRAPMRDGMEVEVRPILEPHDFGAAFTPELRAQEARQRERAAATHGVQASRAADGVTLAPCLWFDREAEEAARFYTDVFRDSRIGRIMRFGQAGYEIHGMPEGTVMTVDFELNGHPFTALNGGPHFRFNEAISLQVLCDSQAEVDYYWGRLSEGGDERAQQCGWLKDRFGLSWQVIPRAANDLVSDPDSPASQRAMEAMLRMKKLDLAELERAYAG